MDKEVIHRITITTQARDNSFVGVSNTIPILTVISDLMITGSLIVTKDYLSFNIENKHMNTLTQFFNGLMLDFTESRTLYE